METGVLANRWWTFNLGKTLERIGALREYYAGNGLNAESFQCRHSIACHASQPGGMAIQYRGGTAGVMPCYDVYYGATPVRLLVVGKEAGYFPSLPFGTMPNFDVKSARLLRCIGWARKNNHIRGTLLTLQKIFQVESEYAYASYALSEGLRCAYQRADRITSRSGVRDTGIMRINCAEHLIAEVRILEPTLVVAQGAWAVSGRRPLVQLLAEGLDVSFEVVATTSGGNYGIYRVGSIMVLTSHHPAILGNWIAHLAPESVWPMLAILREMGVLPVVSREGADSFELLVKPYIDTLLASMVQTSNDSLLGPVAEEEQLALFNPG